MAIKVQKRTNNALLLKLVSVDDSAIDWEQSCLDGGDNEDDRRESYGKDHRISRLKFKEGEDSPTIFVFEHPNRVDVARKLRGLYTKQIAGNGDTDLFTEVWDRTFIGTEDGLDGAAMVCVPRRNGRITDDSFQALEDSGVFGELAGAYLQVANADRAADSEAAKKK